MSTNTNTSSADTLSRTFAALSDPTRRAILERLTTGEASVTELAAPINLSLPSISKHLKVLERAGLIARTRDAQKRYSWLDASTLEPAATWLEPFRRLWEESFDRLDGQLADIRHAAREEETPP